MLARTAAVVIGLAALSSAPAQAAPTLKPLKACYVSIVDTNEFENIVLEGSGFTPSSLVDISIDGVVIISGAPIDAAGNFPAGTIKAPAQPRGERDFVVTVTEQANPAQTVSVSSKVTALNVSVRPTRARPSSRITFSGRGFTDAAAPVWLHYVKGRRHKRTVRLARRPTGPCGTFKVRRRQFPFNPSSGRWIVQIDQQKRYSRSPSGVYWGLFIDVTRTLRRG